MKLNKLRKGFTLVEIMIVVVIIGLLAALAIPAFRKVRNNAIEKSLINDGRQISAGFNQYVSENPSLPAANMTLDKIIGPGLFFAGLSSGNIVATTAAATTAPTTPQPALSGITFVPGSFFSVSNASYQSNLSGNALITTATSTNSTGATVTGYTTGSTGLNFSVDTGSLIDGAPIASTPTVAGHIVTLN